MCAPLHSSEVRRQMLLHMAKQLDPMEELKRARKSEIERTLRNNRIGLVLIAVFFVTLAVGVWQWIGGAA